MADKRIDQLVAATTLGNNDLLVLEQNNQAKKMSGATLASFVYNAATDKIAEVNQAVADAQDAVDSLEEQKNTIAESIASMADLGTDTTLSTTGMAADAKAAGDRINDAETAALAGLDQGNISGVAIASFDDGADDVPVKALKIAIEPQQNLHGYDYPWPAGGGDNQFVFPYEVTGTTTDQGVTFTILDDGKIRANGTSTGTAQLNLYGTTWSTLKPLKNNTTYTISSTVKDGIVVICYVYKDGSPSAEITARYNMTAQVVIPDNSSEYRMRLIVRVTSGITVSNDIIAPMMVVGTTAATSFKPYSNICPITGWTGAKVTRSGKNLLPLSMTTKTVSGVTFEVDDGRITVSGSVTDSVIEEIIGTVWLKKGNYYLSGIHSVDTYMKSRLQLKRGTELPGTLITRVSKENPKVSFSITEENYYYLTIVLTSNATISGTYYEPMLWLMSDPDDTYEPSKVDVYNLAFPSPAGTVYSGTLDATNGVLTVMNFGIENLGALTWEVYSSANNTFRARFLSGYPHGITKGTQTYNKCSCYKPIANGVGNMVNKAIRRDGSGSSEYVYIRDSSFTDANELQASLANQQFVYELATPVTYTLTPPVVRTLLATNNIWADTGNILDLIYRRQPISDADIQENIDAIRDAIADREDSGVASKNYAAGSLILIGDALYEAAGPITTGESLVPGSNCMATTVAAQIAYIKSIIDGLGNLAYLSYENA